MQNNTLRSYWYYLQTWNQNLQKSLKAQKYCFLKTWITRIKLNYTFHLLVWAIKLLKSFYPTYFAPPPPPTDAVRVSHFVQYVLPCAWVYYPTLSTCISAKILATRQHCCLGIGFNKMPFSIFTKILNVVLVKICSCPPHILVTRFGKRKFFAKVYVKFLAKTVISAICEQTNIFTKICSKSHVIKILSQKILSLFHKFCLLCYKLKEKYLFTFSNIYQKTYAKTFAHFCEQFLKKMQKWFLA